MTPLQSTSDTHLTGERDYRAVSSTFRHLPHSKVVGEMRAGANASFHLESPELCEQIDDYPDNCHGPRPPRYWPQYCPQISPPDVPTYFWQMSSNSARFPKLRPPKSRKADKPAAFQNLFSPYFQNSSLPTTDY